MDQSIKSSKIAAGVAITLFLGALTWGAWNVRINSKTEGQLDQEKLRNEQLLSEKLLVEKNLALTGAQMEELVDINESLTRQIEEAKNSGSLKDGSIQQLQRQLASNNKKYNELAASNRAAENKLTTLNQVISQYERERSAASDKILSLESQIEDLKIELSMVRTAYYDRALVESTRGKKDKLVAKASRTKKLKATVVIPSGLKNIQFEIYDPSGKLLDKAPASSVTALTPEHDQAEMVYIPKRKLIAGTYRIEVMSGKQSAGTLQLRLR